MTEEARLREVKSRHAAHLLDQPGVCGVSVEKDESGKPVLAIHLDTDDPAVRQSLPSEIEGHPVKFVRSGPYQKY